MGMPRCGLGVGIRQRPRVDRRDLLHCGVFRKQAEIGSAGCPWRACDESTSSNLMRGPRGRMDRPQCTKSRDVLALAPVGDRLTSKPEAQKVWALIKTTIGGRIRDRRYPHYIFDKIDEITLVMALS